MLRNIALTLSFSLLTITLLAQQTGKVSFPSLGVAFTIPSGWLGQEVESGYIMGSQSEAGLILILPHQTKTIDALQAEARQGIVDQNGTVLQLEGSIESMGSTGISATYVGTIERQPAKAHVVSLINPYGTGATILATTTKDQYTDKYKQLALQVAKSIQFSKPVLPDAVKEWSETLKNARLTYMDSYFSSGASYGGYSTGGGYSDKEEIDLCAQGYFNHSSSSSLSIDTGGAFGNSSGSSQGAGTWKVIANGQGQPVLQLEFYNGEIYEYVITYEDKKTYLNGKRYFRTYGTVADDGPDCF